VEQVIESLPFATLDERRRVRRGRPHLQYGAYGEHLIE